MRYKNYWRTISGILAVCIFIYAGHSAMQGILRKQRNALLSQEGYLSADNNETGGKEEKTKPTLSPYELKAVLKSMEEFGEEEHPELFGRQMERDEAVAVANQWIEEFYLAYIGETAKITQSEGQENIMLSFGINRPEVLDPLVEEDLYGHWTILYRTREMDLTLVLNAVTGQVLRMSADSYVPERNFMRLEYAKSKVLAAYADSLSLHGENIVETDGKYDYLQLKEDGLQAGIKDEYFAVATQKDDDTRETVIRRIGLEVFVDRYW